MTATENRISDIVATAARQNRELRFLDLKRQNPDRVYIFRVGDFCECYAQDAKFVSELTGLALFYPEGFALVGFPYQAIVDYLPQIINAGKNVCIYDTSSPLNKPQQ